MAGRKGRSGRRPKSAAGHLLDGSNRFDRHGSRADVEARAEVEASRLARKPPARIAPPNWLEPEAKRYWRWLLPTLQSDERFDPVIDRGLVADICRSHERRIAAEKLIREDGLTSVGSTGQLIAHPAVQISHNAVEQKRRLEAELELRFRQRAPAAKRSASQSDRGGSRGPQVTDRLGRPV